MNRNFRVALACGAVLVLATISAAIVGGLAHCGVQLRAAEPATNPAAQPKENSSAAKEAEASIATADELRKAAELLNAATTQADYKQAVSQIVAGWLTGKDFRAIDALADELRTSQSRLPSGALKLTQLHGFLRPRFATEAEYQERIALYDEWVKQAPKSITARLSLAAAWEAFSWLARGNGYGSDVSEEAGKLFYARATKAAEIIEQAKRLPDKDPEMYTIAIWVAIDLGWPHERVAKICRDSAELDPTFLRTFIEAARYYMPKWYGAPGDLEQFALDAVKQTEQRWGKSVYIRIVMDTEFNYGYKVFDQFKFSWPLVQQGFQDWNERYPPDKWRTESYCRLACLARDRETAHALFDKIGAKGLDNVWLSADTYYNFKRWAEPDFVSGDQADIIESVTIPLWGLAWTSDPDWLVASEAYSYVCRVHVKTHERVQFGETWGQNMGLCVDPKTAEVYVGLFGGNTFRFNPQTGARSALDKHGDGFTYITLANGGKTLITAGAGPTVKLWDTGDHSLTAELKTEGTWVPSIDVATAPNVLATGLDTGAVQLWSLETRQPVASWKAHPACVDALTFSPDARLLVTACGTEVKLWDREKQELLATLESPPDVSYMQFAPNGKLLVAGTQAINYKTPGLVLVWDVESHKLLKTFRGHKAAVRAVTVSADSKTAATSSWDSSIRLWKLPQ